MTGHASETNERWSRAPAAPRSGASPAVAPTLTAFFDGDCPLCRREIDHYRSCVGAERIKWVDINQDRDALAAHDLSYHDAMARFHVRDSSGQWYTGAQAFTEIWARLARWPWLAPAFRLPGVTWIASPAYAAFARWRLRHRCRAGSCSPAGTNNS